MGRLDWIALAVVALAGFVGLRKGLIASLLAITGIVVGAGRSGPGSRPSCSPAAPSPYAPLVGLGGAVIGATFLESVGSMVGSFFRTALRLPPLRALDAPAVSSWGAAGLALVWVGRRRRSCSPASRRCATTSSAPTCFGG